MKAAMIMMAMGMAALLHAGNPVPTWELGKNQIDQSTAKGNVKLKDGVLLLDGMNSFQIPASVLGKQKDYTIEFEMRLPPGFKNLPRMKGAVRIISNIDLANKTGFGITYLPPRWDPNGGVSNRLGVETNSFWNGELRGISNNKFTKITFMVKDDLPSMYVNGLLISMFNDIKPSSKPITIGGWGWRGNLERANSRKGSKAIPQPYELRKLKIYDTAITPSGYDKSTNVMRSVSGDGYKMQCAVVKDPSLPKILVIGDSISMGYRRFITEHFKGKAYVDYWVGCGVPWGATKLKDSPKTIKAWKGVLSNGPYNVISWNAMTLHWWHRIQLGRCPESSLAVNLTDVVRFLKKEAPKTQIIWIRCTPIRACQKDGSHVLDESPNCNPRIVRYNKIVDGVMKKEGIPEVDLYGIAVKQLHTVRKGSRDIVHWNKSVSKLFADAIIKEITKYLPGKN